MARILDDGRYPVDIEFEEAADGAPSLPPRADEVLASVREALSAFAEVAPNAQPHGKAVPNATYQPAKKSGGFFLPDAFTNPEHVRYALKTTAAAMFCLLHCFTWHDCGNRRKTHASHSGLPRRGRSGIAAIVYLIPSIISIGALMVVVFLGALVSAWVAAGSPRIAYAGFQIAFAFFLCVIQGAGPSFDMTTARDRVIGILLGNIVVYVIFANIWPVSVGKRIDPALAALLRRLGALVTELSKSARHSQAPELQEMLAGIEQDLVLALYEPPSIRPDDRWLGVRRRAAEEVGALFGPLLLTADKDLHFSATIANRLHRLANSLDAVHEAPTSVADSVVASAEARKEDVESAQLPFHDAIVRRLDSLEKAFDLESDRKANYASA